MTADRDARLERVLTRHRDATVVEDGSGRWTVVRRDQILAAGSDASTVEDRARRWLDGRDDLAGAVRFRLRAGADIDVCELVRDLQGSAPHRSTSASPNHLLRAEPGWWAGPEGYPRPAPTIPPPEPRPVRRPITVALLDTGLFPHPWFEGKTWYVRQRDDGITEVLDANRDDRLDPDAGHGTFVAGVVLQGAPSVRLHVRRILGSDGVCDELTLVDALTELWAWSRRPESQLDVLNLSLGCYTFDDRPTPVVAHALRRLGRETAIIASAGNNASDRPFWPAALKSVIAVGALDAAGHDRAAFSNYGWWIDACAVGEDVGSSFVVFDGPAPPTDGLDPDLFRGYATWSGTSFAAPGVAGVLAALSARDDVPAATAAEMLLDPTDRRSLPDLGVVVET
ncbi:MAG: S8 family peptidase [Streptosporangiaceae bacterium]